MFYSLTNVVHEIFVCLAVWLEKLKIPKGQSEAVYRRTDDTMTK